MPKSFYLRHKRLLDRISGLFFGNTVLGRGLVIAPVVIAATSMKNGVFLGIAFFLITGLTVFLGSFIPRQVPYTLRVIFYVLMASLLYIPTAMLLSALFPVTMYKVGIFFPLLITNSLIVTRLESRFRWKKRGVMCVDLLCHLLGFLVVIVAVGAVREAFGAGRLWDIPIESVRIRKTPALLYPFSGFILLGFLSAVLQAIRNRMMRLPEPEEEEATV